MKAPSLLAKERHTIIEQFECKPRSYNKYSYRNGYIDISTVNLAPLVKKCAWSYPNSHLKWILTWADLTNILLT